MLGEWLTVIAETTATTLCSAQSNKICRARSDSCAVIAATVFARFHTAFARVWGRRRSHRDLVAATPSFQPAGDLHMQTHKDSRWEDSCHHNLSGADGATAGPAV